MPSSCDLLLVEDDLLLARALIRSLKMRGMIVRHVGRCATAAALQGPFRLGIFDIELPDGDGVDLARLLRRRGIVARALFYTACAHPLRLARASDVGLVLSKSSSPVSLLEALEARTKEASSPRWAP